jgi:hypothetical protein
LAVFVPSSLSLKPEPISVLDAHQGIGAVPRDLAVPQVCRDGPGGARVAGRVGVSAAVQHVVARAARQCVVATVAIQAVRTRPAVQLLAVFVPSNLSLKPEPIRFSMLASVSAPSPAAWLFQR